jgi:uncharacterized cofD-like protein
VVGIAEAIANSPATKACYVNLMAQPGETIGLTAADHVRIINEHAGRPVVDVAVVNTTPISAAMRAKYAAEGAHEVANDFDRLRELGVEVVGASLLTEGAKIRHDSERAAEIAMDLARAARTRRQTA